MSSVSTHVLDTSRGRPGAGIVVSLERLGDGAGLIASGLTDDDGRVGVLGPDVLAGGTYRLVFDTAAYFDDLGIPAFFPEVAVAFTVGDSVEHYHVPLLLSPFAFSTYRGS
ncbi:MAG: hydroxyisourate hydrolase [Nocardioidaceae bacterium]